MLDTKTSSAGSSSLPAMPLPNSENQREMSVGCGLFCPQQTASARCARASRRTQLLCSSGTVRRPPNVDATSTASKDLNGASHSSFSETIDFKGMLPMPNIGGAAKSCPKSGLGLFNKITFDDFCALAALIARSFTHDN